MEHPTGANFVQKNMCHPAPRTLHSALVFKFIRFVNWLCANAGQQCQNVDYTDT